MSRTSPRLPTRPGRSPVNEQKYAQIVEVASRLFAEKGFDGTSLQDISVEVGVLKGSLYHYITSKEELLAEVVRVGQEGLGENIALCEHFAGQPLEQLVAFAYGHIRLNATPERLLRGIVFLRDGDKLSQDRREELFKNRDKYDRYLRKVIAEGKKQGVIDPEVDTRICSFAVLGVINSYTRWYHPSGPITPDELGRQFAGFALAAIRDHVNTDKHGRWDIVDDVVQRCREIIAARSAEQSEDVA